MLEDLKRIAPNAQIKAINIKSDTSKILKMGNGKVKSLLLRIRERGVERLNEQTMGK